MTPEERAERIEVPWYPGSSIVHIDELHFRIADAIHAAVVAEREACAKEADSWCGSLRIDAPAQIAATIRARNKGTP